jgi:hypothetical protein
VSHTKQRLCKACSLSLRSSVRGGATGRSSTLTRTDEDCPDDEQVLMSEKTTVQVAAGMTTTAKYFVPVGGSANWSFRLRLVLPTAVTQVLACQNPSIDQLVACTAHRQTMELLLTQIQRPVNPEPGLH